MTCIGDGAAGDVFMQLPNREFHVPSLVLLRTACHSPLRPCWAKDVWYLRLSSPTLQLQPSSPLQGSSNSFLRTPFIVVGSQPQLTSTQAALHWAPRSLAETAMTSHLVRKQALSLANRPWTKIHPKREQQKDPEDPILRGVCLAPIQCWVCVQLAALARLLVGCFRSRSPPTEGVSVQYGVRPHLLQKRYRIAKPANCIQPIPPSVTFPGRQMARRQRRRGTMPYHCYTGCGHGHAHLHTTHLYLFCSMSTKQRTHSRPPTHPSTLDGAFTGTSYAICYPPTASN
ncbi:uncharacterized protein CLUP02_05311 [Colletotrichum lupini]|uniref:Uncharacterized protein n=1 Tax=Colletotrichum lupini TaxID=145971 RepID=A0A9Q8SLZ7_9PEZI|nr:uncharacterized protein CLUP02_05311 [Colletotrichum lupini]UQC79831.1 hypothetical protein CLUP02_05311 [Colletotrichum lupini]